MILHSILLLVITILVCGIGHTKVKKDEVRIHKRTQNFIDIEASRENIWVGCSTNNPKKDNSFMVFYVLDGNETKWFMYRRPYSVPQCLNIERDYKRMIKNAETVRIVGIGYPDEVNGPQKRNGIERVPMRFTSVTKLTSWMFSRLQVEKKCKAYFEDDCDLPKNYWANTIPDYNGK